jgi:hypothetical protein
VLVSIHGDEDGLKGDSIMNRLVASRVVLASGLIAACIISACARDVAILEPNSKTEPCGVGGPICAPHACCDPGYRCGYSDGGISFDESCYAGECCLDPVQIPRTGLGEKSPRPKKKGVKVY